LRNTGECPAACWNHLSDPGCSLLAGQVGGLRRPPDNDIADGKWTIIGNITHQMQANLVMGS